MKYAGVLVRNALGAMMSILKQTQFVTKTVKEYTFGYEHDVLKLGNEVLPPEEKLPDKVGFFVNVSTSSVVK